MTLNETIFKSDSFFIPLTLKNFLKGNFICSSSNKEKKTKNWYLEEYVAESCPVFLVFVCFTICDCLNGQNKIKRG